MKAEYQLRQNLETLLRERKEEQKTLARYVGVHPTIINKFLKGTRKLQLAHLDRIADFFGVGAYQLFQPGIAVVTERRLIAERRSGRDRRVGHAVRAMLDLRAKLPTRSGIDHAPALSAPAIRRILEAATRQIDSLVQRPGEQAPATRAASAAPRPRRRNPRGSHPDKNG